MSLADEARTLRERVAARLAELEPLVREYEELQRVAAEIGLRPSAPAGSASAAAAEVTAPAAAPAAPSGDVPASRADQPVPRPTARRRQARRGQSRVAAAAERDARVLEAVSEHPGATVAEIASVLGVDAVSLYRPVRDLASAGKVVKRARGLFPASD
jgi:uncharacterized membrane protein